MTEAEAWALINSRKIDLDNALAKVRAAVGEEPPFHWQIWIYPNSVRWEAGIDGGGSIEPSLSILAQLDFATADEAADWIIRRTEPLRARLADLKRREASDER